MSTTSIEWATDVWNPTAGCDRVSPGCDHCYALTMAKRLKGMGQAKYGQDGDPKTSGPGFLAHEWPDALDWPLTVKKPMRVFVNSMSDLFHDNITDEFIVQVFDVMANARQHTFQVLTKRHARMRAFVTKYAAGGFGDPEIGGAVGALRNVWLGVSVENQQWADIRIPALLDTPAAVRFLSCEPLLGPVALPTSQCLDCCGVGIAFGQIPDGRWMETDCSRCDGYGIGYGIDWVIVGGESGPGARPMHPGWARSLRDQCVDAGVPFLFKQWGEWAPQTLGGVKGGDICMSADGDTYTVDRDYICAHNESDGEWLRRLGKYAAGRELDGREWSEYPR